jgi:hypothetical protein
MKDICIVKGINLLVSVHYTLQKHCFSIVIFFPLLIIFVDTCSILDYVSRQYL